MLFECGEVDQSIGLTLAQLGRLLALFSQNFTSSWIILSREGSEPLLWQTLTRPDVDGPNSGQNQYDTLQFFRRMTQLKTSAQHSAAITEPFQIVPNSVYSSALALSYFQVRQIAIKYQSWVVASMGHQCSPTNSCRCEIKLNIFRENQKSKDKPCLNVVKTPGYSAHCSAQLQCLVMSLSCRLCQSVVSVWSEYYHNY